MCDDKKTAAKEPQEQKPEAAEKKQDELSQEQLNKISGGAFPTAVNSQITDSVT